MNIKELITRAKHGDEQAFVELMQRHREDMYRTALAVLMNDEDVADAIQDTILVCWEKLKFLRKAEYFKTWLIRILLNKCYDIRRKNIPHVPFESIPETGANDIYNLELKEALGQLDEKYRVIIMLYYGDQLKVDEIAQILHMNKSTIQTRLQRGRDHIRRLMTEDDGREAVNA